MKSWKLKVTFVYPCPWFWVLIPGSNAPVTLGRNWTLRWPLHLICNSLDLKCRAEDLYLFPKYFCPYFGIFGSIIPQNALMPKCHKTGKTLGLKETRFDVKYEYKDFCLFMPMIWGLLTISLNCPNAVNTLKEVGLLTKMTSGPLRP